MDSAHMRTWAEIDLAALEHNYRLLRRRLGPGCGFLGVVKADAYGHGALPVARRLEALGAEYLAVACLEEAVALREGGVRAPILLLGGAPAEFTDALLDYRLTPAIFDLPTARACSRAALARGLRLVVHLKADTGMGRLGFSGPRRVEEILEVCALPGLEPQGLFTHFADADGSEDYTRAQFDDFLALRDSLAARGRRFQITHCAASAAMLHYPCTHLDLVRPGIALYGHSPDGDAAAGAELGLVPVMALKTRVAAVRELPAGASVSYGRTRVLSRPSRLAVLPVGYADGLHRTLSNRAQVRFPQGLAPLVGRVCMDLSMADVTDLPGVAPGDAATLFGPDLPLEPLARAAGTIPYELLTAVAPRVPRVYLHEAG